MIIFRNFILYDRRIEYHNWISSKSTPNALCFREGSISVEDEVGPIYSAFEYESVEKRMSMFPFVIERNMIFREREFKDTRDRVCWLSVHGDSRFRSLAVACIAL